jgi:hypothetical protein
MTSRVSSFGPRNWSDGAAVIREWSVPPPWIASFLALEGKESLRFSFLKHIFLPEAICQSGAQARLIYGE